MSGTELCPVCGAELPAPSIESPDRLHGTPGRHRVAMCSRCGAGVSVPRLGDDALAGFYPQEYGPYDEHMTGFERVVSRTIRAGQAWRTFRTRPLDALESMPPGRGLDVGCGRGDLAAAMIARGWTMSGVEPSPYACEVAARRGIKVSRGMLSTVELEPHAYDAVVFNHSLEHTVDPVAAVRSAAAALAPRGLLLVTVPNFGSWQARRFGGSWYHLDLPRHRVHFTSDALARTVRASGLQVLGLSTSTSVVGLPASVQYRVFGRCLFPSGFALRAASGACVLSLPVALAIDRAAGGGDLLHAVARWAA